MPIEHGNLRDEWPWIREKIVEMQKETKVDWFPDDIFGRIKLGEASLYINENKNSFAVLTKTQNQYTGEKGINIMLAFAPPGENTDELLFEIENMAREKGYSFLEIYSTRKGFIKKGWEIESICFKRNIR